ncbi:MAG: glycine cleavage system protein GcvH [Planctomycetaceae bacterium]|nr:glycine cleavage system protein GcvH [Planctomycetaceae bacterium]
MAESLRYSKTHEWARGEGGEFVVGISDFAVGLLSDLVFIDLPEVGRKVAAGETFGEIESVKAVSELYSPLAGEVVAVNTELPDHLEWLNDDPFGKGWLVRLRVADAADAGELMSAEQYKAHCDAQQH